MYVERRTSRRITGALLASGMALCTSSCQIETPQMPHFGTQLRIPLGLEEVTGRDVADSLGSIVAGDTTTAGPLAVQFGGTIERVSLRNVLRLQVPPLQLEGTLGAIAFDIPPLDTFRLRAAEVLPGLGDPPGDPFIVGPFSFILGPLDLGTVEGFERLQIRSGEVRIALVNRLPIPLGDPLRPGEAFLIDLIDTGSSPWRTIARVAVPDVLPPGETVVASVPLANLTIGNAFGLYVRSGSPGSGGQMIEVLPNHGLDIGVAFHEVELSLLYAQLPEYRFRTTGRLDLPQVPTLTAAAIEEGRLSWELRSSLPVGAQVAVRFPYLLDEEAGEPLGITIELEAGHTGRAEMDLAGKRLTAVGDSALTWQVEVSTEATGDPVPLRAHDGVSVALAAAPIQMQRFEGVLNPTPLEIAPTGVEIDIPAEVRDFEFTWADLVIDLYNHAQAEAQADVLVIGRAGQEHVDLAAQAVIAPGTPDLPAHTRITLNPDNSAILDLIHLVPDRAEVRGGLLIGDGRTPVRIDAGHYVDGDYTVTAPLRVIFASTTYTADPFDLELTSDVRERIAENLRSLRIEAVVENHFPVTADVEIHFARDRSALLAADDLILRTGRVAAGALDPATGRVTEASTTAVEMSVVEGELDLFTTERLFGVVVIHLQGGEHAVEFRADDYLRFSGLAILDVEVE